MDVTVLLIGGLIAVGGAAGFLYYHWRQMHNDLTKLNAQILAQTSERARLTGVKAEVERRQQEKAALKQRVDVIEQLHRNRSGGQELLDAVANTVNRVDALWMNGLRRSTPLPASLPSSSVPAISTRSKSGKPSRMSAVLHPPISFSL
jgi:Tfp pilus assembly protein PilN